MNSNWTSFARTTPVVPITSFIEDSMLRDFKRQIVEPLKGLETGDRKPLATINPNKYIQHNLRVVDGPAGFRDVWNRFPVGLPRNERNTLPTVLTKAIAAATPLPLEERSPSMQCGHTRIRFPRLSRSGLRLRSIPSG